MLHVHPQKLAFRALASLQRELPANAQQSQHQQGCMTGPARARRRQLQCTANPRIVAAVQRKCSRESSSTCIARAAASWSVSPDPPLPAAAPAEAASSMPTHRDASVSFSMRPLTAQPMRLSVPYRYMARTASPATPASSSCLQLRGSKASPARRPHAAHAQSASRSVRRNDFGATSVAPSFHQHDSIIRRCSEVAQQAAVAAGSAQLLPLVVALAGQQLAVLLLLLVALAG